MVEFPGWLYFVLISTIFPAMYVLIKKKFNLNIRETKELVKEIACSTAIFVAMLLGIIVFNNELITCIILCGVATILFYFLFYDKTKTSIGHARTTEQMVSDVNVSMQEVTAAAEQISSSVQGINIKADMINGSSIDIDKLLKVLKIISEQINLLSLNASIEANRLGEKGLGFLAVVSELQKLRDDTKIQIDTSSRKIEDILKEIEDFSKYTNEIMAATEEQTSSMEEVMASITKLQEQVIS